jgi:phosphotransferase system  glucose/maltose/N-acetylglucosamine-specific IIC component
VLAIFYFHPAEFYPSPFSWRDLSLNEVGGIMLASFLAALVPMLLRRTFENHYHYRLLMLFAYMAYSFLLVVASGGAIEMHFYLFGIWALLTLYYDWRLIAVGFTSMLLYHTLFDITAPQVLYFYGKNNFSLIAHVMFALIAAIFTINIAKNGRKAVVDIKRANEFIQSKL